MLCCCLLLLVPWAAAGQAESSAAAIREELRQRLEAASLPEALTIRRIPLSSADLIPPYYQQRLYQAAWIDQTGRPGASAVELLAAIEAVAGEGLVPEDYHLKALRALASILAARPSPTLAADLDLLLSDAFLLLGSHLLNGRVNPQTGEPVERVTGNQEELLAALNQIVTGTAEVQTVLEELLPRQAGYRDLRKALGAYRLMADQGGWPVLPGGPNLRRGDSGSQVAALRLRLGYTGELDEAATQGDKFDDALLAAVLAFQRRHGLDPDGVVGPKTLAALNVPAAERVRQIELNLERWRWMPEDLGRRHLLVNNAAFQLVLLEDDEEILTMRVVVGTPYRRTPDFSGLITYLVLNPYWEIPPSITVQDILPEIQRDPAYLEQLGIKVIQGWGAEARIVDPASINWQRLRPVAESFPYRLRQDPGPVNALGRIKFMFPNVHNVYLHDTPARALFNRVTRTFSSGCIRLEKPLELAALLLPGTPLETVEGLEEALREGITQTIYLPEPIPVHLVYRTAWAEPKGSVQFRNDIYGRDILLTSALAGPPTSAP
jgi:L,D-transpeptidase YcbB